MATEMWKEKAAEFLGDNKLGELAAMLAQVQGDPDLSETDRLWLRYYQSRLAWAQQDWRTAASGFRRLLEQDLPIALRVRVLRWLGESLHYGGQWQEQLLLEQEALVLSSVLDDDSKRAAIYNLMGWAYLRQSRIQEALVAFEHSLHLCQGIGSREYEAWALNNLGIVYLRLGDAAKALDAHQASLAIRREEGLRLEEGRSLHNIAEVMAAQGYWRQADKYLRDSEKIAREVNDQIGLSYVHFTRGNWEKGQGRLEEALEAYRQSLSLRKAVGGPVLIAETYWAMADTYRLMGEWLQAAEHAERAATAWRQVVEPWAMRQNGSA